MYLGETISFGWEFPLFFGLSFPERLHVDGPTRCVFRKKSGNCKKSSQAPGRATTPPTRPPESGSRWVLNFFVFGGWFVKIPSPPSLYLACACSTPTSRCGFVWRDYYLPLYHPLPNTPPTPPPGAAPSLQHTLLRVPTRVKGGGLIDVD